MIKAASSAGMMPCLPSMAACAILPVISSLYILLSKEIEEWKWSVKLSVDWVKRPPQSFAMIFLLSFCKGRCPLHSYQGDDPLGTRVANRNTSVCVVVYNEKYSHQV